MPGQPTLRLGTRTSALALVQARSVAKRLTELGQSIEVVQISTAGDQSTRPLTESGGIGWFTKTIQEALLREEIDLAVHSLKDLPTVAVDGLKLIATPKRAPLNDVLITSSGHSIDQLPAGCRVGTGSMRRQAQLLHLRPDLVMQDIRGNIDTRLAKLRGGDYDAIVLAAAGLERLGILENRWQTLTTDQMLPAVGQGALGVEIRVTDTATASRLAALNDPATWAAISAERTLLRTLTAGCLAPVGAWARMSGAGQLQLDAVVLSADGRKRLWRTAGGDVAAPAALGHSLAQALIQDGADRLIQAPR